MIARALGGSGATGPILWFSALSYLLAAVLCLRAGFRDWRAARLWLSLSVALLLFAIAKPLQLQALVTSAFRRMALGEGWYGGRQEVQETFMLLVLVAVIAVLAFLLMLVRRQSPQLRAAAAGFVLLCGFIAIRTASFHDIDALLYQPVFLGSGLRLHWNDLFELAGVTFITISAARARPSRRSSRRFQPRRGSHR